MDIDKEKLFLPVIYQKVGSVDTDDVQFTTVRIWLMHLGVNVNGTNYERDVVERAIPTLAYKPIVGFIKINSAGEKDFSQHKYVRVKTQDGVVEKYLCRSYGVILSEADNNAHFEKRLCDDGIEREFLVVDGVIWNMFEDGAEIVSRDKIKAQSMELWQDLDDFTYEEDENGIANVTHFSFRAACILGEDYEPAMTNSTIEVIRGLDSFLQEETDENKRNYTAYSRGLKFQKKIINEGRETMSDKLYYSQTVLNMIDDIRTAVNAAGIMYDSWGDQMPRYYMVDVQDDEVIAADKQDDYNYVGFPLKIEGDKPIIDFSTGKRKKAIYEDYVETNDNLNGMLNFSAAAAEIYEKANKKVAEANKERDEAVTNYSSLKTEYEEIKPKYEEYTAAAVKAEQEAEINRKTALYAKFDEYLSDVPEYMELKKDENITSDELEVKCSVMYTKNRLKASAATNYARKVSTAVIDIPEPEGEENDNYVRCRYGNVKKRSK